MPNKKAVNSTFVMFIILMAIVAVGVVYAIIYNLAQNSSEDKDLVQNPSAFIAVHMESGGGGQYYPARNWQTLIELVNSADKYNQKLTLQFNPNWATYILQDRSKIDLLRSWEENGHEIALHHHGPTHTDWNGYTNNQKYINNPKYKGTIAEMMSLVTQLPAS